MKQKWLINIYKKSSIASQHKYLGSFKAAKEYAERIISQIPGAEYKITEICNN